MQSSARPSPTLHLLAGLLLAAAIAITACDDGGSIPAAPVPAPAPAPAPAPPPPPEPETAMYGFGPPERLIGPSVPDTVPEGVEYAIPLAIVVHAKGVAPFALDGTASDGLKLLAETGASAVFAAEAEAAGMEVLFQTFPELLQVLLSGQPLELNLERPCFTYVQAIVPSSDWFLGASGVCATDDEGRWLSDVDFEIVAYDAGTADGEDFMVKSGDTEPRGSISYLDVPPYFAAPAVVQRHSLSRIEE